MSVHASAVPVARRLLGARPLATAAGAVGIGLALMLMLLLGGLWAGVQQRVTLYDTHTGADLVVVPAGTDSLFADPGSLPAPTVDEVRATPGVSRAAPLLTRYLILELGGEKAAVAVVGSDPDTGLGGPWAFQSGRPPETDAEVAVDALFAERHDLALGEPLPMLGHPMRVVGLTEETDVFMTPLAFTTAEAMARMLAAPDTTGAVLLTTDSPATVAERLRRAGLTVRTPADLQESSLRLATNIYGDPVRLMVAVAFVAGALIVALVAHTRITEQQRDLGVLKALGATRGRIGRVAVAETLLLTALGTVAGAVLVLLAREALAWWRPSFPVLLTPAVYARTAAAAMVMALLAAWLPARRLARLDPASAFGGLR